MTAVCFGSPFGFLFVAEQRKKVVLLPEEIEEEE
jgi:hypothetical protein